MIHIEVECGYTSMLLHTSFVLCLDYLFILLGPLQIFFKVFFYININHTVGASPTVFLQKSGLNI
jgi:hydrogenase-4 membrane subunit HyfE